MFSFFYLYCNLQPRNLFTQNGKLWLPSSYYAGLRIERSQLEPWRCVVFFAKTLECHSACISQEYRLVTVNCWGNLTECWGVACDRQVSYPGGSSSATNQFMLQKPNLRYTLSVPLFTHVHKWALKNLTLWVTLRQTSIPSKGSRSSPTRFKLQKPEQAPA